jgi:hypothetical protein
MHFLFFLFISSAFAYPMASESSQQAVLTPISNSSLMGWIDPRLNGGRLLDVRPFLLLIKDVFD